MAATSLRILGKLLKNEGFEYFTVPRRSISRNKRILLQSLHKRQKKFLEDLSEKERLELGRRSNFFDWNYGAEIFAFGKRLHENFPPELLTQAFTHSSYMEIEKKRLEEVGVEDTSQMLKENTELAEAGLEVISTYVRPYVSHFFPRFPLEGINAVHDHLTSDELLAHVSKNLGTTFLILSKDYPVEIPTYAKTLQAIIGALKECQGLKRANLFVRDFIVTQLAGRDINDFLNLDSYLEALDKILKRDGKEKCEPRIICHSAVNTILANYHVGLYSNKQLVGHSSGESVDVAIEMAALDGLKRLFHTTDSCTPISYDLEDLPTKVTNLSINEWNSAAFTKISAQEQKKRVAA